MHDMIRTRQYLSLIAVSYIGHKHDSPTGQNGRTQNLRVVIPTPTMAQNLSTDDLSYSEVCIENDITSQNDIKSVSAFSDKISQL